ncbi:MAG: restriction endonuclease [Gammaproteobacteria bacterium]|nr:restriction endonuclease [Gammaproteobacteria bacterium]
MTDWLEYQEEVAGLFRSLGLSAATNQSVAGVRTAHNVDVVVRSKHAGIDQLWLIECKRWNKPVSKDTVLTLRSIVNDAGADRGFMMAESGYQSGAIEAARLTNVTLTSIAALKVTLSEEIGMAMLRSMLERVDSCRDRYWEMSKEDRIALGLRPDVLTDGYRSVQVMDAVDATARHALHRGFPLKYDLQLAALVGSTGGSDLKCGTDDEGAITNAIALCEVLETEIGELEHRLKHAEAVIHARESK